MEEIWKDIPGYEGWYKVSNFGRVRSVDRYVNHPDGGKSIRSGRIIKPLKTHDNYLYVGLWKNGKCHRYKVHRLVYEAFNGLIPEGMQVNHINEDKTDNRLENLNLMTPKENYNWGTRNNRISKTKTNGRTSKPVLQLTLDGELVREWPSMNEAQRHGYDSGNISACCLGKLKTYKGFIWRYK